MQASGALDPLPLPAAALPALELLPPRPAAGGPLPAAGRHEFRCGTCSYGALLTVPVAHSCPVCRSYAWRPPRRVRQAGI